MPLHDESTPTRPDGLVPGLRRRALLAGAGAASLMAVAACGGGGASPDAPPSQPVVTDPPAKPPVANEKQWQLAEQRLREDILRGEEAQGVSIGEPRLALDGQGGGMAIWLRTNHLGVTLWASRLTPAGTWQPVEQIDGAIAREAAVPQIAIGAEGHAIAVWERRATTRTDIGVARYDASTRRWEEAFVLQRNLVTDATAPHIAMDRAGNAVVVWTQAPADDATTRIMSNTYTAGVGGGWRNLDLMVVELVGAKSSTHAQVALDAQGHATAVWQTLKGDESGYVLSSSRLRLGAASWDLPVRLPQQSGSGSDEMHHLAVAPDGTAMVVWQLDRPSGETGIFARRRLPQAVEWEDVTTVAPVRGTRPAHPSLAIDADGDAHVLWDESSDEVAIIRSALASRFELSPEGKGSWSAPVSLERVRGGESQSPRMALDADGNGLAVWTHFDGARYGVQSARYLKAQQRWSTGTAREPVNQRPGDSSAPQLAMRANGTAIAMWGRLEGGPNPTSEILSSTSIWSAEFE